MRTKAAIATLLALAIVLAPGHAEGPRDQLRLPSLDMIHQLPVADEETRQVGIFLARGRVTGLVLLNYDGRSLEVLSLDSGHDVLVDVGRQGSRTHVVLGDCVQAVGVASVLLPSGETIRFIGNVSDEWNPALLPIQPDEDCP